MQVNLEVHSSAGSCQEDRSADSLATTGATPIAPKRILFFKQSLVWPRASGHDVHTSSMIRALGELGHQISLATLVETRAEATAGLNLHAQRVLRDEGTASSGRHPRLTYWQERFRSYWGVRPGLIDALARTAEECQAEAVVVVGLDVLPYLGAIHGPLRIWYAADEWAWHHLSQMRLTAPSTWGEARTALVKGLYERAFRNLVDRTWVVSTRDQRAMRWLGRMRHVDVVANGVDTAHYAPRDVGQNPHSCTFWGRLDFGPNLQALEWFCRHVWPSLRRKVPDAKFTIYGFQATQRARRLADLEGVELCADLPDLRDEISRHQVVVLPFTSGGGIKNKLLEAASLGRAIVCSKRASNGLRGAADLPLVVARSGAEWVEAIVALWADAGRRKELGASARAWVSQHHTWESAARAALAGCELSWRESDSP